MILRLATSIARTILHCLGVLTPHPPDSSSKRSELFCCYCDRHRHRQTDQQSKRIQPCTSCPRWRARKNRGVIL